MNVREKFLELTSKTYPHGTEMAVSKMLPDNLNQDAFGNYYLEIGDDYTTMFTSHLDTADSVQKNVIHTFTEGGNIVGTDGNSILGADCKAGVVIMLKMIENNIPGLYYFFLGEEVGCLGSKWLAEEMYSERMFKGHKIGKVVSFDRRDVNSIITFQYAGRCCSDNFADKLIEEFKKGDLDMEKDPGGVCTDSVQFQDFIPECTNISVGYYAEHTENETQDLDFLEKLSEAVLKIDWESLPVERDPSVEDYSNYDNWWDEWDYEEEEESYLGLKKTWSNKYRTYINYGGDAVEVFVSKERIQYERKIIIDILSKWGLKMMIDEINWDGQYLVIDLIDNGADIMTRADLIKFDSRLSNLKSEDIKYIKN